MSVEQRVAQHLVPVGFAHTVKQHVDSRVALAVQHREEEDKRAKHHATQSQFGIAMLLELAEQTLASRHGAYEVKAHHAADDAEDDARRHTVYHPRSVEVEVEERVAAHKYIGKARRRDSRRKYRQQRRHTEVYHKHLKGEHQSGYRCLEDACDSGGGTTANEQHEGLVVHTEQLTEV